MRAERTGDWESMGIDCLQGSPSQFPDDCMACFSTDCSPAHAMQSTEY